MAENQEQLPKRTDIKLLVVDDREDNLMSIETILERDGYIIRKANSGRAALKVLLNEQDVEVGFSQQPVEPVDVEHVSDRRIDGYVPKLVVRAFG